MKKCNAGFTLLESIIYLALFAILIAGVVVAAYYLIAESVKLQGKTVLHQEANFILRKLDWVLVGATAINDPASNTSSGHLQITKSGGSTAEFQLAGGKVQLKQNGGAYEDLNNSSTNVSSLNFQNVHDLTGSKPDAIIINFTMTDSFQNSQNFSLIRNIRK